MQNAIDALARQVEETLAQVERSETLAACWQ